MDKQIVHLVMFSGGASSAYVAKWIVDKYGKENCMLFFTDTQWEDEDNYRFMEDVANYLNMEITRVVDGRTPEDVFFEQRFLGNARTAKCSEELKVKQTLVFIETLRQQGKEPIIYFGIGPNERHRAESLTHHYTHLPLDPVEVRFPMIDSVNTDLKAKYIIENEWGIKLPRMYHLGFHHANCGGKCVRAGMHHFGNLYLVWPDRYKEFEEMEERFRSKFNLDVSMMKRNGGPFTLKQLREETLEKMTHEELVVYAKEKDVDTIPCFCSFS